MAYEVLSPSTERIDLGRQSIYYRRAPSLQEYLLVAQDEMLIEHYSRRSDGTWTLVELAKPDDVLILNSIEAAIGIRDVYHKVQFLPADS